MWASAFSLLVKKPVHSRTTSIPNSPQGNSSGLALAKRQMLHAYKLEFQNPKTLENLKVEIEIPLDMKEVLK